MSVDVAMFGFTAGWFSFMAMNHVMTKSLERSKRRNQAEYGYGSGPNPLPMSLMEGRQRFQIKAGLWPLLVGKTNDATEWVVLPIHDLPTPPALDPVHGSQSIEVAA